MSVAKIENVSVTNASEYVKNEEVTKKEEIPI